VIAQFLQVKTEADGENYCHSLRAPKEIRFHPKVIAWQQGPLDRVSIRR
jgi:hypothetical protein